MGGMGANMIETEGFVSPTNGHFLQEEIERSREAPHPIHIKGSYGLGQRECEYCNRIARTQGDEAAAEQYFIIKGQQEQGEARLRGN